MNVSGKMIPVLLTFIETDRPEFSARNNSLVKAGYLKVLAKRRRKLTQVENFGQLGTSFGQGLRVLAFTCDDLRSLKIKDSLP